ncbi:hypothetical protein F4861DRAFT_87104 [Xylaria intraflava]|nr:hypothetical protein F4861DRAFT_87104 [Xylaria intraflava]
MSRWRKMRSFFMSDEELGKKDDDHNKPVKNASRRPSSFWQPARGPPRRSLKRIAEAIVLAVLVYLFVHNLPVLGPNNLMRRPSYPPSHPDPEQDMQPLRPDGQRQTQALVVNRERNFNGPLKFNSLGRSLQATSGMWGEGSKNKNVVFAAASLKSAATLLPMACQMGASLKSYVHFALLGRSSMTIQQLHDINGIDKSCAVIYHDARADYAAVSTDNRLEKAVSRGLHHINTYLHPQVIIVDASDDEEGFFTRGVKQHVKVSKTTLIGLPRMAVKSLSWIAKLDSAALRMWNQINIDISIQATPGSSGSLIRLLRSLSAADYASSAIPHITIEFPHHIDPSVKQFLDSFAWPPSQVSNPTNERYLSLRHRLAGRGLTEDETSARFLESFWPTQPQQSHVLVLSPNVELAPQFFYYLKYLLLEYRYSAAANAHDWGSHLFGISLEQPLNTLDGKNSISPPLFKHPEDVNNQIGGISNPFLWQAPTSNAVLFLGDKWMELHDLVSRTMQATNDLDGLPEVISEKIVSKQHPSWMEHALRLARVRGYSFLYPGDRVAEHLATVHGELYNIPEEYANGKRSRASSPNDEEIEAIQQKVRAAPETQLSSLPLLEGLPNKGDLWPLSALPVAAWEGNQVEPQDLQTQADDFELVFKSQVGGCDITTEEGQKSYEPTLTQDLFCNVP